MCNVLVSLWCHGFHGCGLGSTMRPLMMMMMMPLTCLLDK